MLKDSKMFYKILILATFFVFGSFISSKAQEDVPYNHILSVSTYYNPSFAGTSGKYSFSNNFKSGDFGHYNSDMYSLCLSYDMYLNAIQGGIGIIGYYNHLTPNNASANYVGIIYAPKFNLFDICTISPSIKFGYIHNEDKLIINTPIDCDTIGVQKKGSDLSFGLLLNSNCIYAGLSVDHLLEPKINFLNYNLVPLYKKYVVQLGYHSAKSEARGSLMHLNLLYQIQKNNNFLFLSDYYVGRRIEYLTAGGDFYYRLMIGIGYKMINPTFLDYSENSIFCGLGVQDNTFTLGLGVEMPTAHIQPKIIETSIKFSFN